MSESWDHYCSRERQHELCNCLERVIETPMCQLWDTSAVAFTIELLQSREGKLWIVELSYRSCTIVLSCEFGRNRAQERFKINLVFDNPSSPFSITLLWRWAVDEGEGDQAMKVEEIKCWEVDEDLAGSRQSLEQMMRISQHQQQVDLDDAQEWS